MVKRTHPLLERIAKLLRLKKEAEVESEVEKIDIRKLLDNEVPVEGFFVPPLRAGEEVSFIKEKAYVFVADKTALRQVLKEMADPKNAGVRGSIVNVAIHHRVKPLMFIPLQRLYIRAAAEAYEELKKRLGKRLKAFAVVGGALTANMTGVPIKVRVYRGPYYRKSREKVKVYPSLDDLDIVAVVEGLEEEEREELTRAVKEAVKRTGIPDSVIDDTKPIVISPNEKEYVAHYFHDNKPKLFFDEKHVKFVEKLLSDPEVKELAEKKAKEYEQKLKWYVEFMHENMKKNFQEYLEDVRSGGDLTEREKAIYNNLELFLHLLDSPMFRRTVNDIVLETVEKWMKESGERDVVKKNELLRRAMAKLINKYLESAQSVGKAKDRYGNPIIDQFEAVKKYKRLLKEEFRKGKNPRESL